MGIDQAYELCCRYQGRPVKITTVDGGVHRGVIKHVNRHKVFIEPIGGQGQLGGFGFGFWGPGWGVGGFGYGIALGAIAGLALSPLFFW